MTTAKIEIGPKAWNGDRAGRREQGGGGGDREQACLEISRKRHPLFYHFKRSEMPCPLSLQKMG
jgi:hypothetical protein